MLDANQPLVIAYEQFLKERQSRISILEGPAHVCQHYHLSINERRKTCRECAEWSLALDPKQTWEVQHDS